MIEEGAQLPMKCVIRDGAIVIELGMEALAFATKHHPELQDEECEPLYTITDPAVWAKSIMETLNSEREDGSSYITDMFDRAIMWAIEQGEFGVEPIERKEG